MFVNPDYPDSDWPYNFYFNGELMPKWGAWWNVNHLLYADEDWDRDIGYRDIYFVACKIDHVGIAESEDPGVFLYVVQEFLLLLLANRERILEDISKRKESKDVSADEIYVGLRDAAFRMRELVVEQKRAFWTNGYPADQEWLLECMRRAELPQEHPEYLMPFHLSRRQSALDSALESQIIQFHRLAQSSQYGKDIRTKLHQLKLDQ